MKEERERMKEETQKIKEERERMTVKTQRMKEERETLKEEKEIITMDVDTLPLVQQECDRHVSVVINLL
jgi:hypothetical protein